DEAFLVRSDDDCEVMSPPDNAPDAPQHSALDGAVIADGLKINIPCRGASVTEETVNGRGRPPCARHQALDGALLPCGTKLLGHLERSRLSLLGSSALPALVR